MFSQHNSFTESLLFLFQGMKVDKLTSVSSVSSTVMVPEETPEELALVISPEPNVKTFSLFDPNPPIAPQNPANNVTRLSISSARAPVPSSASFPAPSAGLGSHVTTLEVFSDASGVTTAATPTKGSLSPENYV